MLRQQQMWQHRVLVTADVTAFHDDMGKGTGMM